MKKAAPKEKPGREDSQTAPHPEDAYRTIASISTDEIRIQSSRFLALARPIRSSEDFEQWLTEVRSRYHDASHHCFAWRTGGSNPSVRFSDAGEPSGTAGKRILGALESMELTDVGCIVIRWFGGTKLGAGGLARAYGDAARQALSRARIVTKYRTVRCRIHFPIEVVRVVHHLLDSYGASIAERRYDGEHIYDVSIRESLFSSAAREMHERSAGTARVVRLSEPAD